MKPSAWAKQQGISYKTAWRMWRDGQLPAPAEQLPTGTVIVHAERVEQAEKAVLYARVSSMDQKQDLDRQVAKLMDFAVSKKLMVVDVVKEIHSGLNGRRRGLIRLLHDPSYRTIVVEHRDRLARFGFEYLEAALAAQGRAILVVDPEEITDDMVRELHEVIVSLCVRLYGKRAAKNKAKKAMEAIREGA